MIISKKNNYSWWFKYDTMWKPVFLNNESIGKRLQQFKETLNRILLSYQRRSVITSAKPENSPTVKAVEQLVIATIEQMKMDSDSRIKDLASGRGYHAFTEAGCTELAKLIAMCDKAALSQFVSSLNKAIDTFVDAQSNPVKLDEYLNQAADGFSARENLAQKTVDEISI